MGALVNVSRADVFISWNEMATLGLNFNFKEIPFGKYLKPQQIKTFAAGIKIIWFFGGIEQRIRSIKVILEKQT
ncbi:MAG: hypothetical protein GY699_20445, partial [Desulfobacteraceae bacterium]|nr:hypothetical protein [Desulfobacteraceae bacterium]